MSRRSRATRRAPRSPRSRADAAPTSRRCGRRTARVCSTSTPIRRIQPICGRSSRKPDAKPVRLTDSMPASIDRSQLVEPEMVHYAGPGRSAGAGVAVRAEEPRSNQEASGDCLDSRRRRESELRRLARAAQLRRLLQLPPVPASEGLRRHRPGLSREHRLRPRLARRRLHGRRRQGREGRVDGGEPLEDARRTSTRSASACGG